MVSGGFFDWSDRIMSEPPDMLPDLRTGESYGTDDSPGDPDDDGNPPDYPG